MTLNLHNMFPRFAVNGFPYGCFANAKVRSDWPILHFCLAHLSHFSDDGFIQDADRYVRALETPMASFLNHVLGVVIVRSKKQVRRTTARTVIAFMKHAQSFWDWAKNKVIHQPAGAILL